MRTVAICNQKGGVGKTTSVINLGAALARSGRRVLLVDMDPQGQLGIGLGLDVNALEITVAAALERRVGLPQAVVRTRFARMDVCPSNTRLAEAEKGLHQLRARELALRRALEGFTGYDLCLLDTPPSVGLLTENALCAATELIIPTAPTYYALEGTFGLLNMTEAITRDLGHKIELLSVFLNQYDPRNRITAEIRQQLQDFFGPKLARTAVRINTRLNEAQMRHRPIFEDAPRSRGAQDYAALAHEIFGTPLDLA
jgi:chromosome partitioning protein